MRIRKLIWILFPLVVCAVGIDNSVRLDYPKNFPKPKYDLKKNPLSNEAILLGRVLFYDPVLSKDNTISCSSCHSNYNSFSHTDHALSHGIDNKIGKRNAPALMNLAWHKLFMWDGAVNHLDFQALAPISNTLEMDEKIDQVVKKLQGSPVYPKLFYNAFRDSAITGERILKAISQFELTLISCNSKYDRYFQNKEKFTHQEQHGYLLFLENCNKCHTEPLFSNYEFRNNGLPADTTLNDHGRWDITKKRSDSLQFKVPTLRNLSYTYPYMHDGRFKKLGKVIDHYTNGIIRNAALSKELQRPITLSSNDKADLIAFLLTLNDSSFVFNPKFAYPKEILLESAGK